MVSYVQTYLGPEQDCKSVLGSAQHMTQEALSPFILKMFAKDLVSHTRSPKATNPPNPYSPP